MLRVVVQSKRVRGGTTTIPHRSFSSSRAPNCKEVVVSPRTLSRGHQLGLAGQQHGVRFGGERVFERRVVDTTVVLKRFYASSSLPEHQELGLPALSPTMDKGNIAKWKKKEGEKISVGDAIAEIETDKATVDFEATEDGYLAKILYPVGSNDIPVGTVIAIVVENESDLAAFKDYKPESTAEAPKAEEKPKEEATPPPSSSPPPPETPKTPTPEPQVTGRWVPGAPPPPGPPPSLRASPRAKAFATAQGISLAGIAGSGPQGRIIQSDVEEQGRQAAPTVSASGDYTDIPNSQIRKVTAKRLTESKQNIPHYYLSVDCNIDNLMNLRMDLNQKANGDYKLSLNDFVIKAAALALKKVPEVNSSWNEDSIRRYHMVDINVAVNTDRGLLAPLIKDVDKIGLTTINESVRDLAVKAKEGKLHPNQLTAGTFTISNLGMFGIKSFTAVIVPPQACILAVGTAEKRVIVDEVAAAQGKDNAFKVAQFMSVTLSCDHRAVDGAVGAQWLAKFKEFIEEPTKMLL